MALTLNTGLTLILLTVCIGSAQGQETTEYHDLLKQGQKRLLLEESEGDFLYRREAAAILRRLASTEWNYTQSLFRGRGIRALSRSSNVSEACSVGLQLLEYGLLERKPWSLKMLDAFFKVPSGLFDGDFTWPGQYDECVDINEVFTDHQPYNMTFLIRGKYFMANFKSDALIPNTVVRLKIGLCLPDVCGEKDVEKLLDYYMEYLRQNLTLNMTLNSVAHPHTEYETTPELIVASLFCSIIGFLVVVGTLADMFVYPDAKNTGIAGDKHESGPPLLNSDGHDLLSGDVQGSQSTLKQRVINNRKLRSFLVTFSISSNGSKVLSTEAPPPTAIQAVNGVRVLSMGWVILGHTYIFMTGTIKNPGPLLTHWIHRWTFQIVLNAIFSVDSFFLLSGLLVSYLTLQELQKRKGKINWLLFYFHRFWRLTPPMMLVLLVYTAYFQYWGSGPQWPQRSPDHAVCSRYWWRNLIYIQNFFPLREECMAWCWYMANDMQFFVISPLLIYPLYRKPVIGYIIVLALLLMQAVYRGVTSISLKMTMNSSTNQEKFFDEMYQRPYARIAPYVVGVLTGFFLWKSDRNVRMPKIFALLGWVIALIFVSSVIFGTIRENGGHRNSLSVDALYNSLSVMTWSLGLAWVIFACNTGYGGFINTFLSAGIWSPLSRLTYCAYLVHPVIMFIYSLCQRYNIYATDINMVFLFFGFWMCTYIVAFFVSMAFEAPMIGLEKLLLKKPTKSS